MDRLWIWLAFRLPRRLVYFATIRLIAFATQGEYGETIIPDLRAMDALARWR